MIDPIEDTDEDFEADDMRGKWTSIDGKKVMWDRIHEKTGRDRKNVGVDRFVRRKGFDTIAGLLQGSVKKHGLASRIGKSMVLDLFTGEVKARIPAEMHEKFRPLYVKHGILTVACLTSGVAFTIRKYEYELLEALKEAGSEVESLKTILSTWR